MIINLIGKKFNKLTVLSQLGKIGTKIAWKCKCDCGKIIKVVGNALTSNHTKSCGCIKNEN